MELGFAVVMGCWGCERKRTEERRRVLEVMTLRRLGTSLVAEGGRIRQLMPCLTEAISPCVYFSLQGEVGHLDSELTLGGARIVVEDMECGIGHGIWPLARHDCGLCPFNSPRSLDHTLDATLSKAQN